MRRTYGDSLPRKGFNGLSSALLGCILHWELLMQQLLQTVNLTFLADEANKVIS